MVAITSYGCYLPSAELPATELAKAWGSAPAGLRSKRVAAPDEDALTLALAAARRTVGDPPPGSVGVASTTLPYHRRVQAGMVAEGLGLRDAPVLASEHTTSARAGAEALTLHAALVAQRRHPALVLAADVAAEVVRGPDALGAAGVALTLAPEGTVATLLGSGHALAEDPGLSFAGGTDERRRDVGVAGYGTGACTRALGRAVHDLLERLGATIGEFRSVVLDVPDARVCAAVARDLGVAEEQWSPVWAFPQVGDVGAAGSLLGLCLALDAADPGDRILLTAYGPGSAADAVALSAGPGAGAGVVGAALEGVHGIDYVAYLRTRGAI